MDLNQFKDWALAKGTVCKCAPSGGGYCGECVSLINQYLYQVFGVVAGAWGHAHAWANDSNGSVRTHFTRVYSVQAGDVVTYGTTFGGGYGHIVIALGNGLVLDQNGDGNGRIKVRQIWSNYSAILRPKAKAPQGDNNVATLATADIIKSMYRELLGRNANDDEVKMRLNQPVDRLYWDVAGSAERRSTILKLIQKLYNGFLQRKGSDAEIDNWSNVPLHQQLDEISSSPEAKAVTTKYNSNTSTPLNDVTVVAYITERLKK